MTALIEARGLTKRFGRVSALAELDLSLPPGRIVAILGPNGAGKTTFVRTVATLPRPDAGTLAVAGHDVVREAQTVRRMIGLAGQSAAVEEMMTGRGEPRHGGPALRPVPAPRRAAAAATLDRLGLADAGDRLVKTYSGGMRRRLDLGASLVGSPASAPPRRADNRPRSPQPHRAVGRHPRLWAQRAPTSCSPPSTSTKPTTSPRSS